MSISIHSNFWITSIQKTVSLSNILQSGAFKIQGNFPLHKMYFIVEKGI